MKHATGHLLIGVVVVVFELLASSVTAQNINYDRDRAQTMLKEISSDIKKHYYDPNLHGVAWEAKVEEGLRRINAADSMSQALSEVAAVVLSLDDSHTFFVPPSHSFHHDYGWQAQMVGDRCYVVRVRPGSDAEKQGVKPGDELVGIGGRSPNRHNFWTIEYVLGALRPQSRIQLDLVDPVGKRRQADISASVIEEKRVMDLTSGNDIWNLVRGEENEEHREHTRFAELDGEVGVLKVPAFLSSKKEIDGVISKARKQKALVLDLREDPGGSIETLKYLIGAFFEGEVKIGDRVTRSERKPLVAKPHGRLFSGKLVVLVDSKSGSAAEVFARLMQIEKRGTVLGDTTSGSVMEARYYDHNLGVQTVIPYGAMIADADLIMADGVSLEHRGVVPDKEMLPSAQDLANGRDPVLSHAVEMVGGKLSQEDAGKLFSYEWPKP